MIINLKKYLFSFCPILLIFAIWFTFSSPYFVKNKVPFPSTYLVNFFSPWNAYPGFSSPVKNNAMPDIITQIYPWKNLTIESLKNFQIPLWNQYSFSGTPILANYQSAVLSPFNLLFAVLTFVDAWSIFILLQPLLAGLFMYLFLKSLKIKNEGATLGSISFMFCGFITTWMAYGTLGYAILFLPLSLFAIEKYYEVRKSRFLILLSLTFPLSFFSGHFQISIYFFLFNSFYILYKFIENRNIKDFLIMISYSLLGIILSLPQLLPSIELYTQSLRSGIFQKIEVIPWGYFSTLVAPDFLGNPVTRNDWFGHYAEWNSYIGLIPLMLGSYSLFIKREKQILFFILTAIFALGLSFPTPLLDLLVALKIPVLSTSAVSRIIVLFSFSMSVLAAFGLQYLLEDLDKKSKKDILVLIFLFAAIFSLLWLVVMLKLFIPIDKIIIAKQNLILPTIIYLGFSAILLLVLFFPNKRIKKINTLFFVSLIIILLTTFDMLRFANKWMPFDSRSLMYPIIPVSKEFSKISGYNRIVSNLGNESTIYYHLPSLEGYDAVYIKRYGEFIASLNHGTLDESARSVVSFPKYGKFSKLALDFLGVKYIVYKVGDGHSSWTFPFWTYKQGFFSLLYNDNRYQILQNNEAYPRVFLVNKYAIENNPQKILDTMFNSSFDLRKEVVLEKNPRLKLNSTFQSAKITGYAPERIRINTDSNGNSLLFLSDSFYTGWEALVDGKKSEIYRADYTFRAVYVPKGKHIVEFIYDPLSFKLGVMGAVVALTIIFAIEFLRKRKTMSFPKI